MVWKKEDTVWKGIYHEKSVYKDQDRCVWKIRMSSNFITNKNKSDKDLGILSQRGGDEITKWAKLGQKICPSLPATYNMHIFT